MQKLINLNPLAIIAFMIFFSISCDTTEKDWENANKVNSISEYQRFLNEHPSGKYEEDAKSSISNI